MNKRKDAKAQKAQKAQKAPKTKRRGPAVPDPIPAGVTPHPATRPSTGIFRGESHQVRNMYPQNPQESQSHLRILWRMMTMRMIPPRSHKASRTEAKMMMAHSTRTQSTSLGTTSRSSTVRRQTKTLSLALAWVRHEPKSQIGVMTLLFQQKMKNFSERSSIWRVADYVWSQDV